MNIDTLIIEVTRKCNFTCGHCLRGPAQNKSISFEVADKLLSQISSIGTLTFSGGEPSLNVPFMRYFLDKAREKGVDIGNFYLATNGGKSSGSDDFIHLLMDLYLYCSDNEISAVDVSNDDWHDMNEKDENAIARLQCLRFANIKGRLDYRHVIAEGRGKTLNELNGVEDGRKIKPDELYREEATIQGECYVNALGDIIPGCDFSYCRQAKVKLGNILSSDLADLIPERALIEA